MSGPGVARVPKDLRRAVRAALDAGWVIRPGTRHAVLLSPDGRTTVGVPSSPSDWRSIRNTLAELRRGGVQL